MKSLSYVVLTLLGVLAISFLSTPTTVAAQSADTGGVSGRVLKVKPGEDKGNGDVKVKNGTFTIPGDPPDVKMSSANALISPKSATSQDKKSSVEFDDAGFAGDVSGLNVNGSGIADEVIVDQKDTHANISGNGGKVTIKPGKAKGSVLNISNNPAPNTETLTVTDGATTTKVPPGGEVTVTVP